MHLKKFNYTENLTPFEIVKKIEGTDKQYRKSRLLELLNFVEIPYKIEKYSTGENIIVKIGKPPYIGIGSHYDVVQNSPGANDNASAIAVTFDILRKAKEDPLGNIGILGFFFDEEEKNSIGALKGSREYINQNGIRDLIGFYNMELVGSGEKVALWSITPGQNTLLLTTLEKIAQKKKIETYRFQRIVTNTADHLSFREVGLEDSFTLTMITQEDIEISLLYYKAIKENKPLSDLRKIIQKAPVFKNYHQPTDTSKYLNNKTLQTVSNLLWDSIIKVDKDLKGGKIKTHTMMKNI
jgi:Zn-dependent M28 family amino/carboxypeptidase